MNFGEVGMTKLRSPVQLRFVITSTALPFFHEVTYSTMSIMGLHCFATVLALTLIVAEGASTLRMVRGDRPGKSNDVGIGHTPKN